MSTKQVNNVSPVNQNTSQTSETSVRTPIKFAPHKFFCNPSETYQSPPRTPINFAPHQFFGISDPSQDNQTLQRTPIKFAPHQFFAITNPLIPDCPENPIPDMFEGMDEFNTLRRRLMYNHRYREDEPYRIRPEFRPRSKYNGALVTAVFSAIEFLKGEKMIPTKENIHNFLRHSDIPNHHVINVDEALDHAIEHNDVLMQELGEQRLYIGRYSYLWQCVNPLGGQTNQYSDATWEAVKKFLSSLDGPGKLLLSRSR